MKTTGIIFSNTNDSAMGELTKKRATASLPIGGRYRLIDFMLSNLVNSGIISVGVLTKYNYRSLLDHLGSGSEWDLDRKNGGLFILPPFTSVESGEPRGKLEAMFNAIPFLARVKSEYVVMCDAAIVCKIDFESIIEKHIESNADITVAVNNEPIGYKCYNDDIAFEISNGMINEVFVGYRGKNTNPIGMGIYVMKKDNLIELVENYVSKGRFSFERDFLQAEFLSGNIKIALFEFVGTVLRNRDIESYYKNNLRLMRDDMRQEFFGGELPVYTKIRNEVPTLYGENCDINGCFVADGCKIDGNAENSVFFRDVVLERDTRVINSIIMQGVKISCGAEIINAIVEKNTVISENSNFRGAENSPVIVR